MAAAYKYAEVEDILENARAKGEAPFIFLLDNIEDPHNLGAIIRTANLAGAHGVIIPKRRAVGLTGTVAKASAGAMAQRVGSSSTRSAPQRTAISARENLLREATPPRWTKLPLSAQTTGRPVSSAALCSRYSWPRCRGSNSHTTPTQSVVHTSRTSDLPSFYLFFCGLATDTLQF